jgi:hypothetical protein
MRACGFAVASASKDTCSCLLRNKDFRTIRVTMCKMEAYCKTCTLCSSANMSGIKYDKNDKHVCPRKFEDGVIKQVTFLSEVGDCLAVSNKIYTHLGCDTMKFGRQLPLFWQNLLSTSSCTSLPNYMVSYFRGM